jgi:CheY-like chemotaxis protein
MPRILIIDDNEAMRAVLSDLLTQAGYETVEAASGRAAVQVQRERPAELLITDIFMPETDGLEVILHFRQEFPAVKIIAVSGGGSRGMVELLGVARKMGAQRALIKPFSLEELLEAVAELIGPAASASAQPGIPA